jgi:hypothetical protein
MARVTGSIVIDRPVEEVFDAVADQTNEPRYNPSMTASRQVTAGPIGSSPSPATTCRKGLRPAERRTGTLRSYPAGPANPGFTDVCGVYAEQTVASGTRRPARRGRPAERLDPGLARQPHGLATASDIAD